MDSSLVRNWNEEDAELYEKKSSKIVLNDLYLLTSETSMLEQVICDCAAGSCRPNSCTNALGHIQCSEQCKCENNWFKSVDSKKYLEPFLTGSEELGVGIRAKIDIKRGDIVGEYIGRLRSKEDYDYLRRTKYSADKHFYAMSIQQKQSYNGITIPEAVLDATKYSNRTKWINHCKKRPNLQVEIWRVQGHPRAYFRAIYRLPKGTELTYDYGMDEWNPEKCLCSNCSPNEYAKPFIPIPEHNKVRKRKRDKSVDIIARKSARIESQRPPLPVSVSVQTDAVEENAAISEPEAVETKHVGVPKTYVCEVCNKTFNDRSNIKRHKLTHGRENVPLIKCKTCKATFTEKYSLKKHIKSVHADRPELYEKMERDAQERKKHSCSLCSSRFTAKRALVYHEKTKHKLF